MTKCVADEVLGRFARQQHDWFERVRKGSLNPEKVAIAVQNLIDRHIFRYDKGRDDWELIEDMEFTPIDPAKMDFVPFLKEGENCIDGDEMVRRAREELHANLGQHHAEYLLEHQQEIPKEFRKYYLVFTGTVWRAPDGFYVACLRQRNELWVLDFTWLDGDWGSRGRLPHPRK